MNGISAIIDSPEYLVAQDDVPKRYKPDVERDVRQRILASLNELRYGNLATLSAAGWPSGHEAYFVAEAGERSRPVISLFVQSDGEEVANIRANPRVSFEVHKAISFEQRREAVGMQFQGVATIVEDAQARDRAMAAGREKFSVIPSSRAGRACDCVIRVEVLSVVNFDASGRPQWGFIDYAASK